MSEVDYKLVITTSGTGSRLGQLTKNTNKSLVEIDGRPAISYVLDKYPSHVPIVITLGYFADKVRKYFEDNYRDRDIEFIYVSPYEGNGSSLGYSLLQAKDRLQCAFVFHACDTIILEEIPVPNRNWVIGYPLQESPTITIDQYRTHSVEDGKLLKLNDKGVGDSNIIHIGVSGIKDYVLFWKTLDSLYKINPHDTTLSDAHVIDKMILAGVSFDSIPVYRWFDTGNMNALDATRKYFKK